MFFNQRTDDVINRSDIVVCDWDGCIQDITILWSLNIIRNPDIFKDYLNIEKFIDSNGEPNILAIKDTMFAREKYEILDSFLDPNKKELTKQVKDDFYKLYTDDENFYRNSPFLNMIKVINTISNQDICKKIVFLSHYITQPEATRKKEIFDGLFSESKMEFVGIQGGPNHKNNKSTWLNDNLPEWTLFIDDSPRVLLDILNNCDCKNKNILYPRYGYNKDFEETNDELIVKSEVEIYSYIPKIYSKIIH